MLTLSLTSLSRLSDQIMHVQTKKLVGKWSRKYRILIIRSSPIFRKISTFLVSNLLGLLKNNCNHMDLLHRGHWKNFLMSKLSISGINHWIGVVPWGVRFVGWKCFRNRTRYQNKHQAKNHPNDFGLLPYVLRPTFRPGS